MQQPTYLMSCVLYTRDGAIAGDFASGRKRFADALNEYASTPELPLYDATVMCIVDGVLQTETSSHVLVPLSTVMFCHPVGVRMRRTSARANRRRERVIDDVVVSMAEHITVTGRAHVAMDLSLAALAHSSTRRFLPMTSVSVQQADGTATFLGLLLNCEYIIGIEGPTGLSVPALAASKEDAVRQQPRLGSRPSGMLARLASFRTLAEEPGEGWFGEAS